MFGQTESGVVFGQTESGVVFGQTESAALDISTGPLARRTFQTAGPVHFIFHWPVRAT